MTQFIETVLRRRKKLTLTVPSLSFFASAILLVLVTPGGLRAQSSYLPQGSKYDHFLDRMEILLQTNPDLNISTAKPISRRLAVHIAETADSLDKAYPYDYFYHLSHVDRDNLSSLLMNNLEWVKKKDSGYLSKRPWFNTFYKYKGNFVEVEDKDFFLVVDPVIQQIQSYESGNKERVFLNSKGVTLRGMIARKLGFSAYLTDNQERGPAYFEQRVRQYDAIPGAGYFKTFKQTAYDYFDNRASIYFNTWKYVDWQFGYDKNFIGNGYRSLFLSDYAAPYLFLKFNVRIWKLNYQTMFMELISQHDTHTDYQYPKKYGVVHHLNVNATPWLNLGLYENVIFSRADYFDFSYLNPVIFLVSAQQQNGSPDKTTVGLDFKANVGHAVQFYGQVVINEFILHQVLHYGDGYWANKQGLQLGMKYINAFNAKNLDLQFEVNAVRPFTYTHDDTVTDFSHYNQPLAHPLGANFYEFITIAHYQPGYRWNFEGKLIYYRQGLDSAGVNYGGNIFESYTTRPRDFGFQIGSGVPANCVLVSGLVSWQWKENLFIDLAAQYRSYVVHDPSLTFHGSNSAMFTAGVRINMFRRQYDY